MKQYIKKFYVCMCISTTKFITLYTVLCMRYKHLINNALSHQAQTINKILFHNEVYFINLYRTNVAASAMQPCTRCWPNVAVCVLQCMHLVFQLSPCLLETETQTNSTVVPTKGLAFVRSHYVIYGGLGFDIIYGCT